FTRQAGVLRTLVVGALEVARPLSYIAGGESFTRLGVLSAQWSSCARESPTGHCPRTWLRRSASPDPLTETLPGLYPTRDSGFFLPNRIICRFVQDSSVYPSV